MTKKNATRKALWSSIVALLLCFTMLMGATFAWFTDNVSSTGNRIQAGDLEVDLIMYDGSEYVSIGGDDGDIFSQAAGGNGINWEPGKTEIVYLGVKNNGSLALKYNILLNIKDYGLAGALEYALIDGANAIDNALTGNNWEEVKSEAKEQVGAVLAGEHVVAQNGVLDEIIKAEDPRTVADGDREVNYFALAVHMKEEATNEFENKSIVIDVIVNATQKDAEVDSFGPDYDAGAEIYVVDESVAIVNNNGKLGEAVVLTADMPAGTIKVTVPANAQLSSADVADLKLTVKGAANGYTGTLAANQVATGYEIYVDGVADWLNPFVDATGRELVNYNKITVELPIGAGRNDVTVIKDANTLYGTTYDDDAGVVTFQTDIFTPFKKAEKSNITVVYTKSSENEKALIEAIENLNGDPGTVTFKSTTDDQVSINNIADALNGTSGITLVGETKEDPIIKANGATVNAESLTIKHTTIQATDTTTINGNNTTVEDVDYQHTGGSYGLTVSGSNATVKDTTFTGAADQAMVTLSAAADTTATISGTTIKDTSTWGNGSGVAVKTLNGTVDIDDSEISVGGWALQLGNTSSSVKGTVDIANTKINSTGLTVRNVVAANFTKVTFANTWRGSSISFEIGGTTNTFTDCDFQTAVDFMRCGTVNRSLTFIFDNCEYNGTAITAENFQTYFNFSSVASANTHITVIVNGTTVTIK